MTSTLLDLSLGHWKAKKFTPEVYIVIESVFTTAGVMILCL